jgi:hypothetical protein
MSDVDKEKGSKRQKGGVTRRQAIKAAAAGIVGGLVLPAGVPVSISMLQRRVGAGGVESVRAFRTSPVISPTIPTIPAQSAWSTGASWTAAATSGTR